MVVFAASRNALLSAVFAITKLFSTQAVLCTAVQVFLSKDKRKPTKKLNGVLLNSKLDDLVEHLVDIL